MEWINSFTLAMKFSRLPYRYIITDPFDQVLEFVVVYPGVQDYFDKVFIFAINLKQWLSRRGSNGCTIGTYACLSICLCILV
jgi:hypothetical protein